MPTRAEIDAITQRIEELEIGRYHVAGDHALASDAPDAAPWESLDSPQKSFALAAQVGWLGFSADQIIAVSTRVLDGESSEFWMDGIVASDQPEYLQGLAEEIRQDEQAAREPEGVEGPAVDEAAPARSSADEFAAMMKDIGDPPSFEGPSNEGYNRMFKEPLEQPESAEPEKGTERDMGGRER